MEGMRRTGTLAPMAELGSRFTGRRRPLRTVRLATEMRTGDEVGLEIRGIVDHRRHDEPLAAVGHRETIEVLGDSRIGAVWHTVAPQPAAAEVRRDDLQVAAARIDPPDIAPARYAAAGRRL